MPGLRSRGLAALLALAFLPLAGQGNPVEPYRHPSLGPALRVKDAKLEVGHAVLAFTGAYAPLQVEGRTVGLMLAGQGTLDYGSACADATPVFTKNVKDWSGAEVRSTPKGTAVTVPFREARLFLAGSPLPAWGGEAAGALDAALADHAKAFGSLDAEDPCQGLALQAANAPGSAFVVMELGDGTTRWIYGFDDVERKVETLSWAEPVVRLQERILRKVEVSCQPIGWDHRRDPGFLPYRIKDLDVDLRTADNFNARLRVRESLVSGVAGHRLIPFVLADTFEGETELCHLKVHRITDGEGRELAFDHVKDHLVVRLEAPTRPGTPIVLQFEYGGGFLLHPGHDNYWHLGLGEGWYPSFDYAAGQLATFHGTVRTGGGWTAYLPGETVRREKDGELELVETRSDKPLSFISILGGKYFVEEEARDGLTVRIASYGMKLGVARKVLMDQAFAVVSYYRPFLGPFPFKEFTIVELNGWGFGQSPAGMMYITREAFNQLQYHKEIQELATTYDYKGGVGKTMDVAHVFAHELAHQYWGTVVSMATWEDQWLEESFADYCASLYERDNRGKSYYKSNVGKYFALGAESAAMAPIPLANQLHPKDRLMDWHSRTNLVYWKGAALLYALHQELGDEVFLTWFKSIQSNFRWNFATTKRCFDLLAFITKKNYDAFLNANYWGLELPARK